jgi:predicted dienelactone hydrolase
MVEYGINVTNKFGFLNDDGMFPLKVAESNAGFAEVEDPEQLLRRAEVASKKEEKSASQKKADRKNAQKLKKDAAAAAAHNAATKEADRKTLHTSATTKPRDCKSQIATISHLFPSHSSE